MAMTFDTRTINLYEYVTYLGAYSRGAKLACPIQSAIEGERVSRRRCNNTHQTPLVGNIGEGDGHRNGEIGAGMMQTTY